MDRYSFTVGLLPPRLSAGLSRRFLTVPFGSQLGVLACNLGNLWRALTEGKIGPSERINPGCRGRSETEIGCAPGRKRCSMT